MDANRKLQLLDNWCRTKRYSAMGTAMAMLRNNKAEAEDAVQAALIKATVNIDSFDPAHNAHLSYAHAFNVWIGSIVVNSCKDRARAISRLNNHQISLDDLGSLARGSYGGALRVSDLDPDENPALEDKSMDVEYIVLEKLTNQELKQAIDKALYTLPIDQESIIREVYLEETPRKDVAARLNLSYTALVQRVRRGRGRLKEVLETCL